MPCPDAPPYDLVLVVSDGLRADQPGAPEQTLARLEPDAARFDRAYLSTPMCRPERASLLSGGWLPQDPGRSPVHGGPQRVLAELALRVEPGGRGAPRAALLLPLLAMRRR